MQQVSILTRRERRAQRQMVHLLVQLHGVSILTRRERRAQPCGVVVCAVRRRFQSSPAANDGRNITSRISHPSGFLTFQSSPAANDGRNRRWSAGGGRDERFNPHPPRTTGATSGATKQATGRSSFNPHPPRTTGATVGAGGRSPVRACFNPHPPRTTGATFSDLQRQRQPCVSILTRRERRAQPCRWPPRWRRSSQFQSSPAANDGRNAICFPEKRIRFWFQSSPAANDGRNWYERTASSRASCFNPHPPRTTGATSRPPGPPGSRSSFNPHPPRTTGATASAGKADDLPAVSILTRRERRAQHALVEAPRLRAPVSILTRRERRAQPPEALNSIEVSVFQSSPAANDGRNCRPSGACCRAQRFNPHPPRTTGATRAPESSITAPCGFNPHPPRTTGATAKQGREMRIYRVSILTRRERRAQRRERHHEREDGVVSILTRRERRAQRETG